MLGMIAMAENITEQLLPCNARLRSEERYRALTDVSPVGIFRTDLGGMTVFVNERCSTIMGIARDEALGLGWVKSVHPDDVAWLGIAWRRYIDSAGVAPYGPEFRMVRASDRAIVWCWRRSRRTAARELRRIRSHAAGANGTAACIRPARRARARAHPGTRTRQGLRRAVGPGQDRLPDHDVARVAYAVEFDRRLHRDHARRLFGPADRRATRQLASCASRPRTCVR